MAIVVAVAGAGDIVTGGLWNILGQAPDLEILHEFPHFGIVPDVVLYDVVGMQQDGGAELIELVRHQEAAVIVVGRDLRPDLAARAVAQGAAGYVSIEAPASDVLATIRAAACGDFCSSDRAPSGLGTEASLSQREVEILGGIVRGLSNADIADRLSLSPNTIKSYVRATYRKIGVSSRSQAVSWGLQSGFDPRD